MLLFYFVFGLPMISVIGLVITLLSVNFIIKELI
ncbi:hypothetical protein JOC48_000808 [Aquibacillus albus]|uniref:Uncharacterized protein n=1 Tax=Aquibacillus albus TaxID=1168171 RepID=A0ABS2MXA7_9BACI|nr:hypothetical protein [Aquibacillus albus]